MSLINDLAELARAGFKASEIIEISKNGKITSVTSDKVPESDEKISDPEPESGNEPETESEPESGNDPETESEPDYKALYETTKAKLDRIQEVNSRQELPNNDVTIDDIVKNIKAAIS